MSDTGLGIQRGLTAAIALLVTGFASGAEPAKIQRVELPAVDGAAAAIRVTNARLVHTTQLLPDATLDEEPRAQCQDVFKQLDRLLAEYQSQRSDLVKLNIYVRDAGVREVFLKDLATWSNGKPPAVASVATRLPEPKAQIALDAVFVSRRDEAETAPTRDAIHRTQNGQQRARASVLPLGDVVYVAGQAQPGTLAEATRLTLEELQRTLKHLQLEKKHIVQLKCFLRPMDDIDTVNSQLAAFFGPDAVPPVSHVEWISGSLPIEIELIAWAPPEKSAETVSYSTPPWMKSSPVFSRVARLHGNERIYISGLFPAKPGAGEQEVRSLFQTLQSILEKTGSDLKHLAKATYYVSDEEASQQLNRLRPEYYDPQRPPAASKAAVADVGQDERRITLDMIAAPGSGK